MIALKEILKPSPTLSHAWAYGCPDCKFGIQSAPTCHTTQPLYIQRAVQAGMGEITFCHCQAGQTYREHLRKVWLTLQGPTYARLETRIREESYQAPTIHWEGTS